jgi:hypothetical protein
VAWIGGAHAGWHDSTNGLPRAAAGERPVNKLLPTGELLYERDRRRVTRFVTQPPQNTLSYPDRRSSMGVRSVGRKSLTVIIFIAIGSTR